MALTGADAASVVRADAAAALAAIRRPGPALAIWRRPVPAAITAALDGWTGGHPVDLRADLRPHATAAWVQSGLTAAGAPAAPALDWLAHDVARLVERFAAVAGCAEVDVRLETLRHDACWRFHRDHVALRLLCTYRGPGTEWVDHEHATAALAGQRDYRGPLNRLGRFEVAVFRGRLGGMAEGVVHRSPAIAGTGTTRLLLCLNGPMSD